MYSISNHIYRHWTSAKCISNCHWQSNVSGMCIKEVVRVATDEGQFLWRSIPWLERCLDVANVEWMSPCPGFTSLRQDCLVSFCVWSIDRAQQQKTPFVTECCYVGRIGCILNVHTLSFFLFYGIEEFLYWGARSPIKSGFFDELDTFLFSPSWLSLVRLSNTDNLGVSRGVNYP